MTTKKSWQWLKNTYWYVPEANLLAFLITMNRQDHIPTTDQTVIHIIGYQGGYFWGDTVVQLSSLPKQYLSLTGSVTPDGGIFLNFVPQNASDPSITTGFGKMQYKRNRWVMVNQMSSGSNPQLQVIHWANMLQSRPNSKSWKSLPGVDVPLPQFIDLPDT